MTGTVEVGGALMRVVAMTEVGGSTYTRYNVCLGVNQAAGRARKMMGTVSGMVKRGARVCRMSKRAWKLIMSLTIKHVFEDGWGRSMRMVVKINHAHLLVEE
jgi:hypothetical protein